MKKPMILFAAVAVFLCLSRGEAIEINNPTEREAIYQQALIWEQPSWMSADFQFHPYFNIKSGPLQSGNLSLLHSNDVYCITNEDDQDYGKTGMTRKFSCQLMRPDFTAGTATPLTTQEGKREKIKVKYTRVDDENPEVYSEVLGTRLLWALGFAADQMYAVENVNCYGCSEDPFVDRKVDPATLSAPRLFVRNAIEVKYPGTEIEFSYEDKDSGETKLEAGWTFDELLQTLPDEPHARAEALKHRDALKLLSIVIQHADNKSENQRIVCRKGEVVNGKCVGRPVFLIHDIGATFGMKDDWGKLEYDRWIRDPIWSDANNCVAQFKFPDLPDESVRETVISENGRRFLANLLAGFSAGAEGRQRVTDLFLAARMDRREREETVKMWVDAFLAKVDEIRFPLGRTNPNFACKNSAY